ncbi:hypothetical protein EYF80_004343 [Liparis tanakae]|uniref:Uncharacterized protein n=1 Tax=Liparis tanakae TaxID=230148 RepID=A0A4Z2J5Y1_9TELE|nr:hypothetical protein EYF80_004343 [Liparis tanakae]
MSAVRLMTSARGCLDNVRVIVHIPLTYSSQISPGCDVARCDPHAAGAHMRENILLREETATSNNTSVLLLKNRLYQK